MKNFQFNNEMKYVIYGAGGNGLHIKNMLLESGFLLLGILDKRAAEIKNIGDTPVYAVEQFAEKDREKDEKIIIICVKNVFEHVNIARKLMKLGYKNIIYKPFPILQGNNDAEWNSINYAYETLLEHRRLAEIRDKEIACSRLDHLLVVKDELLIEDDAENVLCYMPVELICNYDRKDTFCLLPMAAYYPLLNICRYLLGTEYHYSWEEIKSDFFLYSADWVERSGNEFSDGLKKSMLSSRINVFHEMQKKADIDSSFFVRNAVEVKRKDSFRFYLSTSGRNRISFLIARGRRYIPVHMSKSDYESWLNKPKFDELKEYMENENIDRLFTVVPHPMMISCTAQTTDYLSLFCMPVVEKIYRELHWKAAENKKGYYKINSKRYSEELEKLKIIAAVEDEGCIGRILLMYGMNCYRFYCDEKQQKISKLIDALFYINTPEHMTCMKDYEDLICECRILIWDSRMDSSFVSAFKGDMLFVLQWGKNLCQETLYNGFANKKLLFRTIWLNEKISGWVCTK